LHRQESVLRALRCFIPPRTPHNAVKAKRTSAHTHVRPYDSSPHSFLSPVLVVDGGALCLLPNVTRLAGTPALHSRRSVQRRHWRLSVRMSLSARSQVQPEVRSSQIICLKANPVSEPKRLPQRDRAQAGKRGRPSHCSGNEYEVRPFPRDHTQITEKFESEADSLSF
jgi:hypothetical protein